MKTNLRLAEAVRKAINRLNTSTLLMQRAHYECFDNCREQGYVLKIYSQSLGTFNIAFSENRNSDDIVVYCYENTSFPNNLPATENDWSDVKYFHPQSVDEAAAYILRRSSSFLMEKNLRSSL